MKKLFSILFLFLICSTWNSTAQVQTFKAPPKFLNVTQQNSNTKLLSINGSTGVLQWVDKTSISGTVPNFQSVLNAGNTSSNTGMPHFVLSTPSGGSSSYYSSGFLAGHPNGNNLAVNTAGITHYNTDTRSVSFDYTGFKIRTTTTGNPSIYAYLKGDNITAQRNMQLEDRTGVIPISIRYPETIAIGTNSLKSATAEVYSTAYGSGTLENNTTGIVNDAYGSGALNRNVDGSYNVAIGAGTLQNTSGGFGNTAVGSYALYSLQGSGSSQSQTGSRNTALGISSSQNLTTGWGNVSLGDQTLKSCTTGSLNIVVGQQAGGAITTGSGNIVIANTGYSGVTGITTGSNNVILSPNTGNNPGISTGSGNVIIGKVSGLSNPNNSVYISDGSGNLKMSFDSKNIPTIYGSLGVYADNSAALAAGLTSGNIYRTSTGQLMIVY